MKWPLFENRIKKELSTHRSEVDIDALWKSIEPEVDAINQSRRNRRRGILWFVFTGVLLMGTVAGVYYWNNGQGSEITLVEQRLNENENENENENKVAASVGEMKNNGNEVLDLNEIREEVEIESAKAAQSERAPAGVSKDIKNARSEGLAIEEKGAEKAVKTGIALKTETNELGSANDLLNNLSGQNETNDLTRVNDLINNLSGQNENKQIIKEEPLSIRAKLLLSIPLVPIRLDVNHSRITLPLLKTPVQEVPPVAKTDEEELPKTKHPMGKSQFRFAAGANVGVSYAKRSLEVADSMSADLMSLRETYEKSLETTHLGLSFSALHESGFSLTTGLQFTRITELFERKWMHIQQDSIDGVLFYGVNPNNDTIPVMGKVPHTIITDTHKKYYNRYTLLDVPVILGYQYKNNEWTWGAQAGVFANLSLTTEGRILKNESEDEDIKDLFESRVGLSYYAGLSAGYQLNDHLDFSISPYMRFFPENFAKGDYALSQKYALFGLDARVRYWF